MIDLEPMSYNQWKAERQKYLDSRTTIQKLRDAQYQQWNKSDAYYDNLGDRINQRETSKVPVAGEGTVEFLTIASGSLKVPARFFLPVRIIYGMLEGAEALARQRAGL